MCGRYACSASTKQLIDEFEVQRCDGDGPGENPQDWSPSYNVAPTTSVPVVLQRRPHGQGDAEPVRWLRLLRWGLVPSWEKTPTGGAKLINIRNESLWRGRFRPLAATRRCLLPADGWYEWQQAGTPVRGKPNKQPYFMTTPLDFIAEPSDSAAAPLDSKTPDSAAAAARIALAGVYTFWRNPAVADSHDPQAWVTSCAVLTGAASAELHHIHPRMPIVVTPDSYAAWLDPHLDDLAAVEGMVTGFRQQPWHVTEVSPRVNAVANDDPELIVPLR